MNAQWKLYLHLIIVIWYDFLYIIQQMRLCCVYAYYFYHFPIKCHDRLNDNNVGYIAEPVVGSMVDHSNHGRGQCDEP